MILVSKTYSETTPESVDDCELSDSGFVFENSEYTFRELVRLMRDYREPSCYPANGSTHEWYSSGWNIYDYRTMTEREESIHFSHNNPPHNARYWKLAAKAAGIVK